MIAVSRSGRAEQKQKQKQGLSIALLIETKTEGKVKGSAMLLIYSQYFVSVLTEKEEEKRKTEAFITNSSRLTQGYRERYTFSDTIFKHVLQTVARNKKSRVQGRHTCMLKASGKIVRSSSIFTADVDKGLAFSFFFFSWLINGPTYQYLVTAIRHSISVSSKHTDYSSHMIFSSTEEVQPLIPSNRGQIKPSHLNMNIHPYLLDYRGSSGGQPTNNVVVLPSAIHTRFLMCITRFSRG